MAPQLTAMATLSLEPKYFVFYFLRAICSGTDFAIVCDKIKLEVLVYGKVLGKMTIGKEVGAIKVLWWMLAHLSSVTIGSWERGRGQTCRRWLVMFYNTNTNP